jgi:hypothetical protein
MSMNDLNRIRLLLSDPLTTQSEIEMFERPAGESADDRTVPPGTRSRPHSRGYGGGRGDGEIDQIGSVSVK